MNISLHFPIQHSIPRLLELAQKMYAYEELHFDKESLSNTFDFLIENPRYGDIFMIMAKEGAQEDMVGFVVVCYSFSVEFSGKIGVIDQIFLLSEWRHHGVGSYILPMIESHVIGKKCTAITLEVNIANKNARTFYEQFDYMPRRQHCIMSKRVNTSP